MGKRLITHTMFLPTTSVDEKNWSDPEEVVVKIDTIKQEQGMTATVTFPDGNSYTTAEIEDLLVSLQMVEDNISGLN